MRALPSLASNVSLHRRTGPRCRRDRTMTTETEESAMNEAMTTGQVDEGVAVAPGSAATKPATLAQCHVPAPCRAMTAAAMKAAAHPVAW